MLVWGLTIGGIVLVAMLFAVVATLLEKLARAPATDFDVNKFLAEHRIVCFNGWWPTVDLRPIIACKDGLVLSIQASSMHYCTPRDNYGPYSTVEIGFPSRKVEALMPYAEDPERPTETVYSCVPVVVVEEIIREAGGINMLLKYWPEDGGESND